MYFQNLKTKRNKHGRNIFIFLSPKNPKKWSWFFSVIKINCPGKLPNGFFKRLNWQRLTGRRAFNTWSLSIVHWIGILFVQRCKDVKIAVPLVSTFCHYSNLTSSKAASLIPAAAPWSNLSHLWNGSHSKTARIDACIRNLIGRRSKSTNRSDCSRFSNYIFLKTTILIFCLWRVQSKTSNL